MFFASTRPKFKLRPRKLLVYYSLCLSLVFVVLLCIAQLRATELAPKLKSSKSSNNTHLAGPPDGPLIFNKTNDIYNDNLAPPHIRPTDSIDRDDRANTYVEPSELPAINAGPPPRVASELSQVAQDLAVSPSNTANQLQVRATPTLAQSQTPEAPNLERPSLAELTAAGTAAGLMVHDMMAQADMVNQFPYGGAQQLAGENDDDPDTPQAQLVQQVLMQAGQQQADGEGSLPLQTRQVDRSAMAAAPEPPSEEQMPDSIESLMGADGAADVGADEEDGPAGSSRARQQQAALDEGGGGGGGELPNGGLLSQQAMNQHQSVAAANESDGDGDDDDGDDENDYDRNAQRGVALQQAGSHLYGRNGAVPVLMSSPRYQPPPLGDEAEMMAADKFGVEQEQSLVAPMRDSLVDLNAAAGHYYGKKKKKKVKKVKKKIIIKKKKKKKKKKKEMKYKKIKIIKIKKKKKAKKYHHEPAHHDHGKYYMYAKVPKKKSWEFGFKKGNKKHWIERHEKGHKNKFKTKVKWYDKKSKGKGVHIWDYNHHDKKKKKHY